MSCGFECHQVGGPWIAENPDCPIHGADGIGKDLDQMDEMRAVIRDLIESLEGHRNSAHCGMGLDESDEALIARGRSFL